MVDAPKVETPGAARHATPAIRPTARNVRPHYRAERAGARAHDEPAL